MAPDDDSPEVLRYRLKKCEERLDAGAKSFAEDRADRDRLFKRTTLAVWSSVGAVVVAGLGAAYALGMRNYQVTAMERAVGALVEQRDAQSKERAELERRVDALKASLDVEQTARVGLEELVRAALMPKPRGR